eukprot:Amastigsp_a1156_270.p4 type:complete len:209 gc:universal Amastigsp_a1156_270:1315-689(-)
MRRAHGTRASGSTALTRAPGLMSLWAAPATWATSTTTRSTARGSSTTSLGGHGMASSSTTEVRGSRSSSTECLRAASRPRKAAHRCDPGLNWQPSSALRLDLVVSIEPHGALSAEAFAALPRMPWLQSVWSLLCCECSLERCCGCKRPLPFLFYVKRLLNTRPSSHCGGFDSGRLSPSRPHRASQQRSAPRRQPESGWTLCSRARSLP